MWGVWGGMWVMWGVWSPYSRPFAGGSRPSGSLTFVDLLVGLVVGDLETALFGFTQQLPFSVTYPKNTEPFQEESPLGGRWTPVLS